MLELNNISMNYTNGKIVADFNGDGISDYYDTTILYLSNQGIKEIFICTAHLGYQIKDYVDDGGNFAISLVSGHLGGADDLTVKIANIIQATPVITSSSAVLNKPSVDLIGSEYYWKLDSDARSVTAVSAEVINDSDIGIFQDAGETDWSETLDSNQFRRYASLEQLASSNVRAAIIITDKLIEKVIYKKLVSKMSCVVFRPPVLHIGIGCRKSTDQNEVFAYNGSGKGY